MTGEVDYINSVEQYGMVLERNFYTKINDYLGYVFVIDCIFAIFDNNERVYI